MEQGGRGRKRSGHQIHSDGFRRDGARTLRFQLSLRVLREHQPRRDRHCRHRGSVLPAPLDSGSLPRVRRGLQAHPVPVPHLGAGRLRRRAHARDSDSRRHLEGGRHHIPHDSRVRTFRRHSHAGYILVAVLGPSVIAKSAIVYYLFVYTFANYLAFFVFGIIGHHRPESFDSLRGLSKENPTLAVALAVAAFSLAGIPPLAGFIGKFLLFESAAEVKSYALVAFAVLNNVIALYYYIQLIKGAWVDKTDDANPLPALEVNFREKAAVVLLTIAVIFTGVVPFLSENIHYILSL